MPGREPIAVTSTESSCKAFYILLSRKFLNVEILLSRASGTVPVNTISPS